jgi:PhnB protein
MTTINVYLTFNGYCEEAFNFYKSVFGGEFHTISRFKEMPPMEGMSYPPEEAERLMHISLPISKETVLMGSDSSLSFGPPLVIGNNYSISVNVDSEKEADRIFNALSDGGKVGMPMGKTFWGSYFGMFTDKYGINWMISSEAEANK